MDGASFLAYVEQIARDTTLQSGDMVIADNQRRAQSRLAGADAIASRPARRNALPAALQSRLQPHRAELRQTQSHRPQSPLPLDRTRSGRSSVRGLSRFTSHRMPLAQLRPWIAAFTRHAKASLKNALEGREVDQISCVNGRMDWVRRILLMKTPSAPCRSALAVLVFIGCSSMGQEAGYTRRLRSVTFSRLCACYRR